MLYMQQTKTEFLPMRYTATKVGYMSAVKAEIWRIR